MKIIGKVGISNPEALSILKKRMKSEELNYEQQATYEYLKAITKISEKETKQLKEELKEIGLSEEQVLNLVNILPDDENVVKLILKDIKELKKEQIKKIIEIISKYKK
ncbi:MAG: hypothetical protein B6U88_02905 [Candidatus Aenigmarchaeota archaeon ex4484_56]|nr:MAG: hypothetical protein B6U88_02905 [Candidatus Aenigmarchaeota archaeon ex4484_56]